MTNPDNAIGTNGAYNGRTSVDAFNDDLSVYSRGILNGWSCVVSSGLTVALGGVNGVRDVAVATDNNGNNTTINNISQSPVQVTISSAPATNSRIDLVVAYVDNPPQGVSTTADNPNACGLIVVKGSANASPVEPDDGAIRTAITADGASGATAYYVILAKITIASGTTDLDASNITAGDIAELDNSVIGVDTISEEQIAWGTFEAKAYGVPTGSGSTISVDIILPKTERNSYFFETFTVGSFQKPAIDNFFMYNLNTTPAVEGPWNLQLGGGSKKLESIAIVSYDDITKHLKLTLTYSGNMYYRALVRVSAA